MAISDKNTRIGITINKDFKKTLEDIAKEENRPLSNLIIKVMQDYVNNKDIK